MKKLFISSIIMNLLFLSILVSIPDIAKANMSKSPIITIIYDNNPYNPDLKTAWGFSCFISGRKKNILFDTGGEGKILLENMKKLGISPSQVDIVFLSHIHGDHVGGLFALLKENQNVTVYIPKSFPKSFKKRIKKHKAKFIEIHTPMKIFENLYSTGEMGSFIKEQSLIITTNKGLIVITGCAHPGVVRIAKKAKELLNKEIFLVIGGFHLVGSSKNRIKRIVDAFKKLKIKYVAPCHCSGDIARKLFKESYGNHFIKTGVGSIIDIGKI